MLSEITEVWINAEVNESEIMLACADRRALNLWKQIRVTPAQWTQFQYEDHVQFWVVAVMGQRCIYFNDVESGWGWGSFQTWGRIDEYHWEQLEIHHLLNQAIWLIDNDEMASTPLGGLRSRDSDC